MVEGVVSKLAMWNAVDMDDRGLFTCTPLGVVAATLYYHPKDVHHWASCLAYIDQNDLWENTHAIAYLSLRRLFGCHIFRVKMNFVFWQHSKNCLRFGNIG